MNRRLNNRGFTLVEMLAVLVILIAIMGIAIPSISSSLERTKSKQNEARYKLIESAAEQYVVDHKNTVYNNLSNSQKDTHSCFIQIVRLSDYLSEDNMKDADDLDLSLYYIIFTKPNIYDFSETVSGMDSCI